MSKKIITRKDYEKYKISQDIQKYLGDFVVDLKSKIPSKPSFADLLSVGLILSVFIFFTNSICSKLYEKKNNN